MDTTKKYCDMCYKAKELQKEHKWNYGDWLIAEHAIFMIGDACFYYDTSDKPPKQSELPEASIQSEERSQFIGELIWLPRIDQFVYMIRAVEMESDLKIAQDFGKWTGAFLKKQQFALFFSMEQLWLSYVMEKLYNRRWTYNEWREIDEG